MKREEIEDMRNGLLADAAWCAKQGEDRWSDEAINALCDQALTHPTRAARQHIQHEVMTP